MIKLFSAIAAAAVLATGAATITPAAAQPARVIVRGATPLVVPSYSHNAYVGEPGYGWYDPTGIGYDPHNFYYDPAGKVPNERYYGPPAVDMVLARTLTHNNESMMGHIQACQAHHHTYSAASNTYYGPHGVPVPCYF